MKSGDIRTISTAAVRKVADEPDAASVDPVADATPLGMEPGDTYPIDPISILPGQQVTDMIMKPSVTPPLEAAQAMGRPTVRGYEALKGQTTANMHFFIYR